MHGRQGGLMQIHEVMLPTLQENRLTDFFSGLVGGLGGTVAQPQQDQKNPFQDPDTAVDRAQATMAPQVLQLGQGLSKNWLTAVNTMMQSARATDIAALNPSQVARVLNTGISQTLSNLSKGQLTDYKKMAAMVLPAHRATVQTAVQNIDQALGSITQITPDRANRKQIETLWQQVAKNLMQSLLLVTYYPAKKKTVQFRFTQDANGNLLINRMLYKNQRGLPVAFNSPAGRRVMAQYQGMP